MALASTRNGVTRRGNREVDAIPTTLECVQNGLFFSNVVEKERIPLKLRLIDCKNSKFAPVEIFFSPPYKRLAILVSSSTVFFPDPFWTAQQLV